MSGTLRGALRRTVPSGVKRVVWRLRDTVAPPPVDDAVLANYRFLPEQNERPRLNLVIRNLARSQFYGGIKTGLDIFILLSRALSDRLACDLRVVLTDPTSETETAILDEAILGSGGFGGAVETFKVTSENAEITVRKSDLFLAFNWWGALNIRPIIAAQAAHWEQRPRPLIYLIQEYEPQLKPFSSANVLAREAIDNQERLWAIFNSANLRAYVERQGHEPERSWVFEPVIHEKLRPWLDKVSVSERKRRILVYGRPSVERNCFPALMRGLRRWSRDYAEAHRWEVISAGKPHRPFPLQNGISVRSVGMLGIEEYASMLLESSVGISLMASPHPSYPPLEMSHFGLRTITNSYTDKDLGGYHPNLVSIDSIGEETLAGAIAECCERHGQPVSSESNAEFLRTPAYGFLGDLVEELLGELG